MSESSAVLMSTPAPRKRILVIEDDPSIVLGLRMNLEAEGYSVQVAEDGEAGLTLARTEEADLIILDLMLPRLNGFEVLRQLRAERIAIPAIVLSARDAELDIVMGLEFGGEAGGRQASGGSGIRLGGAREAAGRAHPYRRAVHRSALAPGEACWSGYRADRHRVRDPLVPRAS
jgi:CheY-like chemotaxis protein